MHCNFNNKKVLTSGSVKLLMTVVLLNLVLVAFAQPVTGVWRGRIIRGQGLRQSTAPVEIKLVAQGDSIVGTAYYYGQGKSYIRYSLKGYFGQEYNTVYWQDYHLVDMYPKKPLDAVPFDETLKAEADFSCPDGKNMKLDGVGKLPGMLDMRIELKKMEDTFFPDEWDEVIEGYFAGMARNEIIDSVWGIASEPYIAKTATTRATGEIAGTRKVTGQNNTISASADDVVKLPPVVMPKPDVALDPEPDTLIAVTTVKETIVKPVPVADTLVAVNTIKETTVKPPPIADTMVAVTTVKVTTPQPPPTPAKPAPKPAAPVDMTAEIAKTNRRNNPPPTNPVTPPVEKVVPKPEPPAATALVTPPLVPVVEAPTLAIANPVMEEAFRGRKKVVQKEIPVEGDTLELRFYDNADVDGDSISLFLNGVALFQHVRLDVRPYIFKIPLADLPAVSELTMVAENLGAIPPNTSYMEAYVKGQRYTGRLESTEVMSAVIRLVKKE